LTAAARATILNHMVEYSGPRLDRVFAATILDANLAHARRAS
jgi:hypothetical protein